MKVGDRVETPDGGHHDIIRITEDCGIQLSDYHFYCRSELKLVENKSTKTELIDKAIDDLGGDISNAGLYGLDGNIYLSYHGGRYVLCHKSSTSYYAGKYFCTIEEFEQRKKEREMTKRITLQVGDWVKLSDIPNEQVFNLVKHCFINAGFCDSNQKFAKYNDPDKILWKTLLLTDNGTHCYGTIDCSTNKRQLSLSDVFNSLNGGFDWYGLSFIHILKDDYSISPFKLPEEDECLDYLYTIKRIPESDEAVISTKVSQWYDYEKGCAVGLPERNTVVLYNGREYEVIRSTYNDAKDRVVLLCLNKDRPNTQSDLFWKSVVDIRPLDWDKLSKRKEVVEMAIEVMSDSVGTAYWRLAEKLYDQGMLKLPEGSEAADK